jgi:hypothetical protein
MATVEQLYQELLGRAPDVGGLEYWQREIGGDGVSEAERARFLEAAQPELSSRPAPTVDVGQVYQDVLGRAADEQGRQYWQNYFGTEASPEELAAFRAAAAPELAARTVGGTTTVGGATGAATTGAAATPGTGVANALKIEEDYLKSRPGLSDVRQLYSDYLNREGDPEGLKYWTDYFNKQTPGQIDANELAAFRSSATKELSERGPTAVDQWYNDALRRPADESGRAYWTDQINKVGFTQARNMFYNQAVRELLSRTAVNTPPPPPVTTNTPGTNVIGNVLPGGSGYQPTTINVGGAGAVTSGGFAAYPYNATSAAATLGRPAYDVTQFMTQNPVQPFVATPLFAQGQVPFIPNPYVPSPYTQKIPTGPAPSPGGLFSTPTPPGKG